MLHQLQILVDVFKYLLRTFVFPPAHLLWSLVSLQGMSEEAVRQTRSQKRALERDALPQLTEPSSSDSESKKPKLDPSESTTDAQTNPETHPAVPGSDLSRTKDTPKHEKHDDDDDYDNDDDDGAMEEDKEEQGQLPSAVATRPVTDDEELTQRWETSDPSSDNRTDCHDSVSHVKTELAVDARSRPRVTEAKAASSALAGGEVKATIKVEVQTGEQPVDMSTSRR